MNPSSRTPEGQPNFCPICRHEVFIEPSSVTGDGTCPFCGHLLWFVEIESTELPITFGADRAAAVPVKTGVWDSGDAKAWMVSTIITAALVAVLDMSLINGTAWLLFGGLFGREVMPRVARLADRIYLKHRGFLTGVVLGWGLYSGSLFGPPIGALIAVACEVHVSFLGAALGLVVGPLFAAAEGIIVAPTLLGLVNLGFRLWTGRWLSS